MPAGRLDVPAAERWQLLHGVCETLLALYKLQERLAHAMKQLPHCQLPGQPDQSQFDIIQQQVGSAGGEGVRTEQCQVQKRHTLLSQARGK